jgi:hypothetical protein
MKSTAASTELERLNPFVGVWDTEGEMKPGSQETPAGFKAIDTYEWLPGGHFLIHRFDADMPDGKIQGIEVIGYSQESNSYSMHSFDSSGKVSIMQARVEKDTWTFVSEGAAWQPWMNVRLKKRE